MEATSALLKLVSLANDGSDPVPDGLPVSVPPEPEYALLLDVAAPLERPRVDHAAWDGVVGDRRSTSPTGTGSRRRSSAICVGRRRPGTGSDRPGAGVPGERAPGSCSSGAATDRALRSARPRRHWRDAAQGRGACGDRLRRPGRARDARHRHPRRARSAAGRRGSPRRPRLPEWCQARSGDAGAGHVRVATPHDVALVSEDQLVAVELHRHIAIAEEGGALRSRRHVGAGANGPRHRPPGPVARGSADPRCFHFTRNRLGGSARRRNTGGALAQICDINRIVQREQVDWDVLARTSTGLRPRHASLPRTVRRR